MTKRNSSVQEQDSDNGFGEDDEDEDEDATVETGKRGRKKEDPDMTPENRFRERVNGLAGIIRPKLERMKSWSGSDKLAYTNDQVEKVRAVLLADVNAACDALIAREAPEQTDSNIF